MSSVLVSSTSRRSYMNPRMSHLSIVVVLSTGPSKPNGLLVRYLALQRDANLVSIKEFVFITKYRLTVKIINMLKDVYISNQCRVSHKGQHNSWFH